jgi:hypothetical protein
VQQNGDNDANGWMLATGCGYKQATKWLGEAAQSTVLESENGEPDRAVVRRRSARAVQRYRGAGVRARWA